MAKHKILVVEDENIIAQDIVACLDSYGYDVVAVEATGEGAVRRGAECLPDLALMDVRLRGAMDGVEAAAVLRREHGIGCVYLTSYSDESTVQAAKLTDSYGYILKPFNERELHTVIEMALHRHAAEKKLQANRQWLQTTLCSIGDAVMASDLRGRITFINNIAQRLTGVDEQEALGRPLEEVFATVHRTTGANLQNPVSRVLEEGETISDSSNSLLRSADGREYFIDHSAAPIHDGSGVMNGVVLSFRDCTEGHRRSAAIQRSEALNRAVVEGISDALYVMEQEGDDRYRCVLVNPAYVKLSGKQPEQMLGMMCGQLFPPDTLAALRQRYAEVLASGVMQEYEATIELAGRRRHVINRLTPIAAADGHAARIVTAIQDISTRKEAEREMRYRVEFKRLIASMSTAFLRVDAAALDEEICGALAQLGRFTGVERVCMYQFEQDQTQARCTHEWHEPYLPSRRPRQQGLLCADYPLMLETTLAGELVHVPHLESLTGPLAAERDFWLAEGALSLAAVPMYSSGRVNGLIGFTSIRQEKQWSDDELELLKIVGELFANTFARKRVEVELRKSEERLNLAQSVSGVGSWEHNLTRNEAQASDQAYRLYGLTPGARPATFEEWVKTVHPEDRRRAVYTIFSALRKHEGFDMTYRVFWPDGSIRWHVSKARVFRGLTDADDRLIGVNIDITERRQALDRLRESEQRYRNLVEHSPDAIVVHSDGKLVYSNPAAARLFGAAGTDEMLGMPIMRLVHPDYRDFVKQRVAGVLEQKRIAPLAEEKFLRLNGMPIDVEVAGIPIDFNGAAAVQVVIRDISARKHDEAALQQAKLDLESANEELERRVSERTSDLRQAMSNLNTALKKEKELGELKTRFVSLVSHEFRTPLAGILSSAELLDRYQQSIDAEERERIFERIYSAVAHMTAILENVLAMSSSESEGQHCKPEILQVESLAKEAIGTAQAELDQSRHIELALEGTPRRASLDPSLTHHILINLLNNALKYSTVDTPVRLLLQFAPQSIVFTVTDYGLGIPAEDIDRIFEPFHRAQNVSVIQGTGLGLAIVKQCVEIHGGEISVVSELGVGTSIRVELPEKSAG